MQHIIGMPPHMTIMGMPIFIIAIIRSQHIFIMSMVMPPSMGIILQTIPSAVISQVIMHMGIIGMPIMGIVGMVPPMPIIGIIPPIPIMGIPIMGIMPIGMVGFIGICMAGIMIETPEWNIV